MSENYTKNFIELDEGTIKTLTVNDLDTMIAKVASAVYRLNKLLSATNVHMVLYSKKLLVTPKIGYSLKGLVSLFPALGKIIESCPNEKCDRDFLENMEIHGIKASIIFDYVTEVIEKTMYEFWETDLFRINHFAKAYFPRKYIATISEFFKDILFRTMTNLDLLDLSDVGIREIEFKGRIYKIYKKAHKIIYMLDCVQNIINTFGYRRHIFNFVTTCNPDSISVEILPNINNYRFTVYDKPSNARKNGYKPYYTEMCKMIGKQMTKILNEYKSEDSEEQNE